MMFLSSCVFIYSLLLTQSVESWRIPVRGYVKLNDRVFNLTDTLEAPSKIASRLVSKITQTLADEPVPQAPQNSEEVAQSPPVEPSQTPVTVLPEPQEPVETSSEFSQAPAFDVPAPTSSSTTSTSTTTTSTTTSTTTTTPAPTTPSTTTTTTTSTTPKPSTQAPRVTFSKTHVSQQVVKEPVKSVTKTQVKATPSKTSAPKAETKSYTSPAKTARGFSQVIY